MNYRSISLALLASCLLAASTAMPMANGATGPYLTIGIAQSAIKQTTINGYNGVLVNYTSTYSSPIGAFVYLDLASSAGQTVYWNVGACNFAPGQKAQCFVVIASTVPKGIYSASVFATTNSSIPISATASLQVTL